jgi:SAM-dependent methyltransferase
MNHFPDAAGMSPAALIDRLPRGRTVVDVDCFGWLLGAACVRRQCAYIGVDRREPPGRPAHADFATMDGHRLDLADDVADLAVASHVIEHLREPVEFVGELARITRPGGRIFIEAPSELSAMPPSSDDAQDHSFDSFWDDPTHVRPYTLGALYRLAVSAGLRPERITRGINGTIPVVSMVAKVLFAGAVDVRYCSFKEVPSGWVNAMRAVWPERPVGPDDARDCLANEG